MKKKFIATLVAAVLAFGLMAGTTGCAEESFAYDDANKYSVGTAELTGNVTDLEVDWLSGSVNVAYGDVSNVTFSETSEDTLSDDFTIRYWLENTTLHIKYAKSGVKLTNVDCPEKDLTVTLPKALSLTSLEIDSVDAAITVTDVSANEVEIETIAGNINASFDAVQEISLDSVSGNMGLSFKTAPKEGEFKCVSGNVNVKLPENTGFTAEMEKMNGKLFCDFETTKNGNVYTCGDGVNDYEFELVSGDLTITKLAASVE